jgi:hypothetical protein
MQESIRNETLTIPVTAITVSGEVHNATRSVIILTNTSLLGETITLAWGAEAAVGAGIPLAPGGFHSESMDAGFTPSGAEITAIASAATATLAIHERIIYGEFKY